MFFNLIHNVSFVQPLDQFVHTMVQLRFCGTTQTARIKKKCRVTYKLMYRPNMHSERRKLPPSFAAMQAGCTSMGLCDSLYLTPHVNFNRNFPASAD